MTNPDKKSVQRSNSRVSFRINQKVYPSIEISDDEEAPSELSQEEHESESGTSAPDGHKIRRAFGSERKFVNCPHCQKDVTTTVQAEISLRTHLIAVGLFFSLIFTCVAWVPYVTDRCKTRKHYCPYCGSCLSEYYGLTRSK